jgi:hypothetical protein
MIGSKWCSVSSIRFVVTLFWVCTLLLRAVAAAVSFFLFPFLGRNECMLLAK